MRNVNKASLHKPVSIQSTILYTTLYIACSCVVGGHIYRELTQLHTCIPSNAYQKCKLWGELVNTQLRQASRLAYLHAH